LRLLSVRLIISLIVGVTLVSLFSAYYEVRREKQGLRNELERRAEVLGESLVGNIEPRLEKGSVKDIKRVVDRFGNREHLAGVAVFNTKLEPIAASSGLPQNLQPESIAVPQAITQNARLWASWSSCTTRVTLTRRAPWFGARLSCGLWCRWF
jgi:hypothetical protein